MDDDFTRCDPDGGSCYFLNNSAMSFASAQKACKRLGGAYLVAWNSQSEQVGVQESCCLLCCIRYTRCMHVGCVTRDERDERDEHARKCTALHNGCHAAGSCTIDPACHPPSDSTVCMLVLAVMQLHLGRYQARTHAAAPRDLLPHLTCCCPACLPPCLQLAVEKYFRETGRLLSYYWTGLIKSANLYYWPDDTLVNNGATSNADPYAHFPYNYQDRLAAYPTFIYTMAHTSWSYGTYTGVCLLDDQSSSRVVQSCCIWQQMSLLVLIGSRSCC
jgi:hypothetical protein